MEINRISKVILAVLAAFTILLPAAGAGAVTVPGTIRVALAKQADSFAFKVSGGYQLVDRTTGQVIITLSQGENWQMNLKDGRMELQGPQGHYGPFSGPVIAQELNVRVGIVAGSGNNVERSSTDGLMALNGEGRTMSLSAAANPSVRSSGGTTTLAGRGGLNLFSLTDNAGATRYRGCLEFRIEDGKLTAVNELNIEDYLRGVVPAEAYSWWPAEALKAQAVAARNYALQRMETTRGRSFNVTNDIYSQVYKGYDAETSATNQAVEETRGVVMLNRGDLIAAYFHASSGGYTENCQDVWGSSVPYIQSKADPYDKNDKYYNWQVSYTTEQLTDQLKKAGYQFNKVTDLEEVARTASGARVEKILVKGEGPPGGAITIETADKVRVALGLKSALFTMNKVYDKDKNLTVVNISGSGYGHGLGLSQWGAYGMAKQGYNYQDILKYYYSGITIANGYGRSPAP